MNRIYKNIWILIPIFLVLVSFECNDQIIDSPDGYETMHLLDFNGLDGCSWILQNEQGENFEPINLNDFSIDFVNGKKYFVKYEVDTSLSSICMVGDIIRIQDIINPALE